MENNQPPVDNVQFIRNCDIARSAKIMPFVNLYDCTIGEHCFIGPFCELGGVVVGARTKISSHCYIPPMCEIGSDCFIAHGVMFTNDTFEAPAIYDNIAELSAQWTQRRTVIGNSVRIGSGAVILPVRIGNNAIIGAGAVVTRDVPDGEIWAGVPGRQMPKR